MTKMKYNGVHADALRKAHAAKVEKGQRTRDAIVALLHESNQPLVAIEVRDLLTRVVGHSYDYSYIKNVLDRLVADGKLSIRPETETEQEIRKPGDGRGRHMAAHYYWAPVGQVPIRTTATVATSSARRPEISKRKKTGRKSGPAKRATVQTGTSVSTDVVTTLVLRIAQLEQQLAEVRKLVN